MFCFARRQFFCLLHVACDVHHGDVTGFEILPGGSIDPPPGLWPHIKHSGMFTTKGHLKNSLPFAFQSFCVASVCVVLAKPFQLTVRPPYLQIFIKITVSVVNPTLLFTLIRFEN